MAWRFKASKYKNATPIVPKPEACIRNICVGSYQTYGNNITASAAFMAFNVDHNGSSLAVLPIDDCGRKSKTMPLLHAHSDTVTDMDFSPFHDGLLATGSQDCLVKLWHIPEKGLEENLCNPECTFFHKQRRVETVCFHPTADCLLTSTSFTTFSMWNIAAEKELYSNSDHGEVIQSVSWRKDGTVAVTSCKDKQLRVLDPRASKYIHICNSHQSIKDSRVIWLGSSNRILSTGFDMGRQREVIIRDVRKFEEVEKSLTLDSSTGILIPLYDADTGMLFLAGKGDTTISYLEVTDREPYLVEGIRHSGEQTKGACLVPKRALSLMQAEVNRVLQLTSSSVIPIMYQVPRKTYREFHADLFPDTTGYEPQMTASEWFEGHNIPVPKISLDPSKWKASGENIQVHRGSLSDIRTKYESKSCITQAPQHVKPICEQDLKEIIRTEMMRNENNCHNGDTTKNSCYTNSENDVPVRPKPKPRRSSRTSSLSECDALSRSNSVSDADVVTPPRPVARPRTTSVPSPPVAVTTSADTVITTTPPPPPASIATSIVGVYKPRLGPKPFTPPKLNFGFSVNSDVKETTDFSFDKIFSVPSAPGQESGNITNTSISFNTNKTISENNDHLFKNIPSETNIIDNITHVSDQQGSTEIPIETDFSDNKIDVIESPKSCAEDVRDKNSDFCPNTENVKCDIPDDSVENKPSKAHHVGIVDTEQKTDLSADTSLTSDNSECTDDLVQNSDHVPVHGTSIAERRRLYEHSAPTSTHDFASLEKSNVSPTPLRRKDSFKTSSSASGVENSQKEEFEERQVSLQRHHSFEQPKQSKILNERKSTENMSTPAPKRTSTVFGCVSKFRHLKVTPLHKSTHIENIRNISRQIPGECDGFCVNPERVAVPLSGPGGKIAVFELSKTGKLPDGVIPTLVNGTMIMDFAWDPFDYSRLAVACDNGSINLWAIPETGLQESCNTPSVLLCGHTEKIYFIKFHPLAKDVLASGSYDMTIKIWDLATESVKIILQGHTDQIFCFAFSPCGSYCSTVCKDGKIRIYKPRTETVPLITGKGPVGSRGARIVWALDGKYIVVLGFDKFSERQIQIYKSDDLSNLLNTVGLDVSPAILIPFYDEDSSTLFLTGKGDSTIYAFEISDEPPYICPLSHHRCTTLHQGLSFFPKYKCNVRNVEFAHALRLTNSTIEPLSFTVPRIKSDLFQDDLFPPTKLTWKPTMSSGEWFSGIDRFPPRISLKPDDMKSLSDAQCDSSLNVKEKQAINKVVTQNEENIDSSPKGKQQQIQCSMSSKVEMNLKLEQDDMEGVDENEWED